MNLKTIVWVFLCITIQSTLLAQSDAEKPESTLAIAINQDNAFGFYPAVYGSFGVDQSLSFSYYGLFWTNPSFGNATTGTDFWTEMGIGLSFGVFEDRLLLNPSLGFTHGRLLSGGPTAVVGDGIVPSLTGFLSDGIFEAEFFGAYYKALRKEGPNTYDYLLFWIYPGIVINDRISLGFHYESFILTRTESDDTGSLYSWTGGYLKFTLDNQATLRLSAGVNIKDSDYSPEYYKLAVVLPLQVN
jgi:hypothetical protein